MKRILLFILFILPAFAANAIDLGTCSTSAPDWSAGNLPRGQCKDELKTRIDAYRAPQVDETSSYLVTTNNTATNEAWIYYAKTNTGESYSSWGGGSWNRTTTSGTCPANQIPSADGRYCVADPAAICQARSGQSAGFIHWKKSQGANAAIEHDGCRVAIEDVNVCLPIPAENDWECYSNGTYTGEPAATGGIPLDSKFPPNPLPPNPLVVPSETTNPAPGVVVESGAATYTYETLPDGSIGVTNLKDGAVTTTTNTTTGTNGPATTETVQTVAEQAPTVSTTQNIYVSTTNYSGGGGGQFASTPPATTSTGGGTTTSNESTSTYPDGSTSTTCEGPACANSPKKPPASGDWRESSCSSSPFCSGDPIQCAQAREAWRTHCAITEEMRRVFGTKEQNDEALQKIQNEAVNTPAQMAEKIGIQQLDLSAYSTFTDSLLPSPVGCPADRQIMVMGYQVAASLQPFCDLADLIRPMIIMAATFMATMILYRAISRKG